MTATVSCASAGFMPGAAVVRPATGRGVLDGLRLAVKDLIDLGGSVTGGGTPAWAASHGPAEADAPCVARLRAAGAQVVGKTVSDELAFSLEGENAHYGTPRHPLDAQRLPGGSSSGSAAVVAWGEADIALGTDTGGSVRVPAAFCGVYGMRPSHGRIGLQGVLPFAPGYDTVGWFARDAKQLQAMGQVLLNSGASGSDVQGAAPAPLRLCIATDAIALADPPVRDALTAWAARAGIVQERQAFNDDWREALQAYTVLQGLEIRAQLGDWVRHHGATLGTAIAPRFAAALALEPAQAHHWPAWRAGFARALRQRIGPDEAWLVPAAPCVALPRQADAGQRTRFYERALALGSLAGHAGLPQVVMPLASALGLPVGVSFIAAPSHDERLLQLAVTLSAQETPP